MFAWPALIVLTLAPWARADEPSPPETQVVPVEITGEDPEQLKNEPGLSEPETPPAEAPAPPDAQQRLSAAVRAYQEGRPDEARVELAALVNDTTLMDAELRQQARVYLGEVLYVDGQEDAAFKVFEVVLTEDPDYRVDPFRHPPDVCGFFEVVRASTSALTPPPTILPPAPSPAPLSAFVGFGVYQVRNGLEPKGALMMAGQLGLGVASAAGYAWITSQRRYHGEEALSRLQTLKLVQWSATAGFWGLYVWGTLDARADWRARSAPSAVGTGVSGSW